MHTHSVLRLVSGGLAATAAVQWSRTPVPGARALAGSLALAAAAPALAAPVDGVVPLPARGLEDRHERREAPSEGVVHGGSGQPPVGHFPPARRGPEDRHYDGGNGVPSEGVSHGGTGPPPPVDAKKQSDAHDGRAEVVSRDHAPPPDAGDHGGDEPGNGSGTTHGKRWPAYDEPTHGGSNGYTIPPVDGDAPIGGSHGRRWGSDVGSAPIRSRSDGSAGQQQAHRTHLEKRQEEAGPLVISRPHDGDIWKRRGEKRGNGGRPGNEDGAGPINADPIEGNLWKRQDKGHSGGHSSGPAAPGPGTGHPDHHAKREEGPSPRRRDAPSGPEPHDPSGPNGGHHQGQRAESGNTAAR